MGGLSSAFLHVGVNAGFPIGAEGLGGPDAADNFADDLVVEGCAGLVALVVHRPVGSDAEAGGFPRRVDVGAQEEELPAVLLLLVLDHAAHRLIVVAAAGVFAAVRGDDEQRFFRHILPAGVLVDVADVVDGAAHGVQQGRAAPGEVLLLRHGRRPVERQAVVDDRALAVEEHGGDQRLARLLFLFRDHGVEAADGVPLQPAHGAAAVQDENQFCHRKNPPSFDYAPMVACPKEGLVACQATNGRRSCIACPAAPGGPRWHRKRVQSERRGHSSACRHRTSGTIPDPVPPSTAFRCSPAVVFFAGGTVPPRCGSTPERVRPCRGHGRREGSHP